MVKQKSLKGSKDQPDDPVYKMDKYFGEGVMFRCKLFGSLKVSGPRGDEICGEAITQLKQHAKQMNKEHKLHKQRIFLNISLKGIRIIDQQSRKLEHAHVVHKISYISHDKDDRRTFGYIVSLPDGYYLFAFKAEKNAGIITGSLKELFHVVYLKYKHDREKQSNAETDPAKVDNDDQTKTAVEEGQKLSEVADENPYAVPAKFQLFEEKVDDANSYAVPSSIPAFDAESSSDEKPDPIGASDTANLLDWTDVNEELEILQNDMKRSDTKQLLAELGDFDLDTNPPYQPESQSIFADDPFFKTTSSSSTDFSNSSTSAFSPVADQDQSDPFFPASDDFSAQTGNISHTQTGSGDFGAFDAKGAFDSPFASVTTQPQVPTQPQPSSQFGNDWSASFSGNGLPTLQPTSSENSMFSAFNETPAVELKPEKISETKKGGEDPFAALSGGISDIRGTLPTAGGANVPQFPKKTKPVSTGEPVRVISPGPSIQANPQPGQGPFGSTGFGQQSSSAGFSQTNPFSQPSMPYNNTGYSAGMNAPPIPTRSDMPPIPVRQDLVSGFPFQPMQQQQQQFAPPIPKPFNQSQKDQGGSLLSNSASPAQPTADPFANLGGAFSISQTTAAQDSLYAVVDKSQKTSRIADQGNADLLGVFGGSTSLNGNGSPSVQTSTSNQDPFGFGF